MFGKYEDPKRGYDYLEVWFSPSEHEILRKLAGSFQELDQRALIYQLLKEEAERRGLIHD